MFDRWENWFVWVALFLAVGQCSVHRDRVRDLEKELRARESQPAERRPGEPKVQ